MKFLFMYEVKDIIATTDYLRSIDERTNSSGINNTSEISQSSMSSFLSTKVMSFASFILYKKTLEKSYDWL
jgi:hypothetical protein